MTFPMDSGDVPRVDGQLAVARAFGDKSIKDHLSSDPHVVTEIIDNNTEFAILASDGIWHVSTVFFFTGVSNLSSRLFSVI